MAEEPNAMAYDTRELTAESVCGGNGACGSTLCPRETHGYPVRSVYCRCGTTVCTCTSGSSWSG